MKTLIAALALTLSSTAFAQHGHHNRHHNWHYKHHWHHKHHDHGRWIVPAIIGGAVVYAATRPDPIVVQQPTIILQPNQIIIDGIVYTKQIMLINGVQTEVLVKAS
jgi:hypothetical protein